MANKIKTINVEEDYHNILECPVCREYFVPPIFLCTKGHSICSTCKGKTSMCPVCKEMFSLARNFSLEHIVEKSSFPCTNAEFGCEEVVFTKNKEMHEKVCPYKEYTCIVGKFHKCEWKGRKIDILDHVKKEHKTKAWMKEEHINIIYRKFNTFTHTNYHDNQIIEAFGEIFYYQFFFSKLKKCIYISIHHIGPKQNHFKYFYKLHFKPLNKSMHEILFCTETHSDDVEVQDLVDNDVMCFALKQDMANYFLENENLAFAIGIMKYSY